MPSDNVKSEKKKALIAYKEKILEELKYYDKRIEDVRSNSCSKTTFFDDSSDSETDLSVSIDCGPTVAQLKLQQTMVKTCLQATQELTNLQILQSEVNVLVEAPVIEGEAPVTEPGIWREVTAECRVDLVPFSVTFFVHQPERRFAPVSYRGLRVTAVKAAHEAELNKSVLPTVGKPSNAVEVLKSYASAHRSRRTSLARLAEKYASDLFMEPKPDGGYVLRCANLLEVSWSLQNKWSPIAPFHHRMKFDLEYMDESYIKIITQAHRQLSDPTLETDERTLLLSKIIATCLEAQGPTQELYESMSSDPETAQTLRKRRTTLDQEIEAPNVQKKKDSEVMAPPKSLPKKAKPKGKENTIDNKKAKRANSDENFSNVKKLKTIDNVEVNVNSVKETDVGVDKAKSNASNKNNFVNKTVEKSKNNQVKKSINKNTDQEKNTDVASVKNTAERFESTGNIKKKSTNDKIHIDKAVTKNRNITDAIAENTTHKIEASKNNAKTKTKEKMDKNKPDQLVIATKNTDRVVSNKNVEKVVKQKSNLEKVEKTVSKNQDDKPEANKNKNKGIDKEKSTKDTEIVVSNKIIEKVVKHKSNLEKVDNTVNINKEADKPEATKNKNKCIEKEKPTKDTDKVVSGKNVDKVIKQGSNLGKTVNKNKENDKPEANKNKDGKDKEKPTKDTDIVVSGKNVDKVVKQKSNLEKVAKTVSKNKEDDKPEATKNKNKGIDKDKPTKDTKTTQKSQKNNVASDKIVSKNPDTGKTTDKNITEKNNTVAASKDKSVKNKESTNTEVTKKQPKALKPAESKSKSITSNKYVTEKNKVALNKENQNNKVISSKINKITNDNVESTVNIVVEKSRSSLKRKSNLAERTDQDKDKNVASAKKQKTSNQGVVQNVRDKNKGVNAENKIPKAKNQNNFLKKTDPKLAKAKIISGGIKTHTTTNINKFLKSGNTGSAEKGSKIPQKLSFNSDSTLKKNPLRISPRKIPSKFKTSSNANIMKTLQKTTNIPRLLKKPSTKT